MKTYVEKVSTINPAADFNRAPMTAIKGITLDLMNIISDLKPHENHYRNIQRQAFRHSPHLQGAATTDFAKENIFT
jgi:hypothetical protein